MQHPWLPNGPDDFLMNVQWHLYAEHNEYSMTAYLQAQSIVETARIRVRNTTFNPVPLPDDLVSKTLGVMEKNGL